jgi:hypothetical protein
MSLWVMNPDSAIIFPSSSNAGAWDQLIAQTNLKAS